MQIRSSVTRGVAFIASRHKCRVPDINSWASGILEWLARGNHANDSTQAVAHNKSAERTEGLEQGIDGCCQ